MLDNAPNVPGATLPDPHPRAGGLRVSSERHPEGPTTNEASPCRQDPPGPAARRGCPSVPLAQAGGVGFRGTLRREGWLSPSSVPGGTRTGVASGRWHQGGGILSQEEHAVLERAGGSCAPAGSRGHEAGAGRAVGRRQAWRAQGTSGQWSREGTIRSRNVHLCDVGCVRWE